MEILMAKFICYRTCQLKMPDGSIRFFTPGESVEADECPPHFEHSEKVQVDFIYSNKSILENAEWSFTMAKDAIFEKYGVELKREEGTTKAQIIDQILDIRFRALDVEPNKVVAPTTPSAKAKK